MSLLILCVLLAPSLRPAAALHCYQCTGESTDPDEHCTDSGWVSIPRGQRLAFKFLCPDLLSSFCMTTVERWESKRPGVRDKYRTRRACSGPTRLSENAGSDPNTKAAPFYISNGCTDFAENPASGGKVQMCFCSGDLCNGASRLSSGWDSVILLLLASIAHQLWPL